jgi:PTH1 family peptidyl-tRNA hydrolase
MAIRAVVGLGNPGPEYQRTRHNAGKIFLDYLSERLSIPLDREKDSVRWGEGEWMGARMLLVFPLTYMNLSGLVIPWLRKRGVELPENLLVISDDIDLPVGDIRFRESGGSGGQKGLSSLIAHLGSGHFSRIRIGVGRPDAGMTVSDHVLGTFRPEEREAIGRQKDRFFAMFEDWCR